MSPQHSNPSSHRHGQKKTLEQIKADARAFALSDTSTRRRKKKNPQMKPQPVYDAAYHNGQRQQANQHPRMTYPPLPQRRPVPRPPQPMHNPRPSFPPHKPTVINTTTTTAHLEPPVAVDNNKADKFDSSDDYELFVKSLALSAEDEELMKIFDEVGDDDDEEDFQLPDGLDDDDDDDDDDNEDAIEDDPLGHSNLSRSSVKSLEAENAAETGQDFVDTKKENVLQSSSPSKEYDLPIDRDDILEWDMSEELAQELGSLEEEDIAAAVARLLDQPSSDITEDNFVRSVRAAENGNGEADDSSQSPTRRSKSKTSQYTLTEPGETSAGKGISSDTQGAKAKPGKTTVSQEQCMELRSLLQKHYQLLAQQAVLAVREAHKNYGQSNSDTNSKRINPEKESAVEQLEILDGAVGMLQDLNQNRKDGILHYLQFHDESSSDEKGVSGDIRSPSRGIEMQERDVLTSPKRRRLTRSQFTKTLQEHDHLDAPTLFNIPGLQNLEDIFGMIDKSVNGMTEGCVLGIDSDKEACKFILEKTGAEQSADLVPGARDVSENFVDVKDILGDDFKAPCSKKQEKLLRRSTNMFTSAEDTLLLRGVNLYGEKQWSEIGSRFLPERSFHNISLRYNKLCLMLFRSRGIKIDENGQLETPPKYERLKDVDKAKLAMIKKAPRPAIMNVHRWSWEEDLTILSAVSVMGNMWSEIEKRFIPHRHRANIRKRYQVLERRCKSAVQRSFKADGECAKSREMKALEYSQKSNGTGSKENEIPDTAGARLGEATVTPSGQNGVIGSVPSYDFVQRAETGVTASLTGFAPPPLNGKPLLSEDNGSRWAVEQLIRGDNHDASQMSAISKIMRGDAQMEINAESPTRKSTRHSSTDTLAACGGESNITLSGIENATGFSVLDAVLDQTQSRTVQSPVKGMGPGPYDHRSSLLDGVLKRSDDRKSNGKSPEDGTTNQSDRKTTGAQGTMPPPAKQPHPAPYPPYQSYLHPDGRHYWYPPYPYPYPYPYPPYDPAHPGHVGAPAGPYAPPSAPPTASKKQSSLGQKSTAKDSKLPDLASPPKPRVCASPSKETNPPTTPIPLSSIASPGNPRRRSKGQLQSPLELNSSFSRKSLLNGGALEFSQLNGMFDGDSTKDDASFQSNDPISALDEGDKDPKSKSRVNSTGDSLLPVDGHSLDYSKGLAEMVANATAESNMSLPSFADGTSLLERDLDSAVGTLTTMLSRSSPIKKGEKVPDFGDADVSALPSENEQTFHEPPARRKSAGRTSLFAKVVGGKKTKR